MVSFANNDMASWVNINLGTGFWPTARMFLALARPCLLIPSIISSWIATLNVQMFFTSRSWMKLLYGIDRHESHLDSQKNGPFKHEYLSFIKQRPYGCKSVKNHRKIASFIAWYKLPQCSFNLLIRFVFPSCPSHESLQKRLEQSSAGPQMNWPWTFCLNCSCTGYFGHEFLLSGSFR